MPPSHVEQETRRRLIRGSAVALGTLVLGACAPAPPPKAAAETEPDAMANDVTATEGLMREHGVLRRILLVFSGAAATGNRNINDVTAKALHDAAALFRDFGGNYHETKLEEAYIFPDVKKAGGPAAAYVDILLAQHARGREITEYIFSLTGSGAIASSKAASLNQTMQQFARMYQHHTAWEETIVFPAWKNALKETDFDELGDKFEAIADQQFGKDSYQEVVDRVAAIESVLNMSDLAQFTAAAPSTEGAKPIKS
jgi:hemerythrin-like domain-containing protein